jgi:protein tyrosine phosphatase (PTP) superfamily phosphohydrolase (DUF442 family)
MIKLRYSQVPKFSKIVSFTLGNWCFRIGRFYSHTDYIKTMTSPALEEIHSFIQISEKIATAGQPTAEQFAEIKAAGYEVVVNLAPPNATNAIANEKELVETQGMEYVYLPVVWEEPTLNDIDRFFSTLEVNSQRQVFVHCALNMRVSAFMYLYRRIQKRVSNEVAIEAMNQIWTPNDTWQAFIDQALEHYQ